MVNNIKDKDKDFNVEIGLNDNTEWSRNKLAKVKAFIKSEATKRPPERRLKNEILAIRYQMEEYLSEIELDEGRLVTLEAFLNAYLKALKLPLRKFARSIDTTDGNLKKYLSGERKFNIPLAMKFANFFHTSPDLWLKVQVKNDLIQLKQQKDQINKYKKYDYEKVLEIEHS